MPDRAILAAPFTLAEAQQIVARDAGYTSWAMAVKELRIMSKTADRPQVAAAPRLRRAFPQLFVADVSRTAAFYVEQLGFTLSYVYGEPPFYGSVARDGVGLNLRHVDTPPADQARREREVLLSALVEVEGVKELFLEWKRRGVAQTLKAQPWDHTDFIVRDPDGNLVGFTSPNPPRVTP